MKEVSTEPNGSCCPPGWLHRHRTWSCRCWAPCGTYGQRQCPHPTESVKQSPKASRGYLRSFKPVGPSSLERKQDSCFFSACHWQCLWAKAVKQPARAFVFIIGKNPGQSLLSCMPLAVLMGKSSQGQGIKKCGITATPSGTMAKPV